MAGEVEKPKDLGRQRYFGPRIKLVMLVIAVLVLGWYLWHWWVRAGLGWYPPH